MANISFILYLFTLIVAFTRAIPWADVLDESFTDVVELPTLKRNEGERKFKLNAFGHEIDLDLKRTDGLLPETLPVYVYGEDDEGNPTVDDWTHRPNTHQQLFTDGKSGASVMIEEVNGESRMSGLIREDLIIEPITDVSITDDVSVPVEKREVKHLRHVIYKVKKSAEKTSVDDFGIFDEEEVYNSTTDKEKRALPERIYVPVQVVVDYALWKKLDGTEDEAIKYVKIYFNAVNQGYSSLSWPSVSVSIYGIVVCKTASACSMIENNRISSGDRVYADKALTSISQYAYNMRDSIGENFAVMMVMTGYDICHLQSSGACDDISGRANVATACGAYSGSRTLKTGVCEDSGVYNGLNTVIHEMGHVLGMMHDGDGPAKAGAPGARSCDWEDSYLMGKTDFSANQFIWSKCSIAQLRWMSVQHNAACLRRKPSSTRYSLINLIPGKQVGLDNQCKVLYGASSKVDCNLPGFNSGNDKLCVNLLCKTGPTQCTGSGPPAEGSYCGPQRFCQEGKCVCDPSAPLPTAPPRDPNCRGDHFGILLNGKTCTELLTGAGGLSHCTASSVNQYCCDSAARYCKPTAQTCSSPPVTAKPARPSGVFTPATTTTETPYRPPTSANCGKSCVDNARVRIDGQTCGNLLGSDSSRRSLCDNPTVIENCCSTRARVCRAYHWISESCDPSCQDDPTQSINNLRCVPFLSVRGNKEDFCTHDVVKQRCCASKKRFCNINVFGK